MNHSIVGSYVSFNDHGVLIEENFTITLDIYINVASLDCKKWPILEFPRVELAIDDMVEENVRQSIGVDSRKTANTKLFKELPKCLKTELNGVNQN